MALPPRFVPTAGKKPLRSFLQVHQLEDRTVPSGNPWEAPGLVPGDHDHQQFTNYIPDQFHLTGPNAGYLTGPTAGDPQTIARAFLAARATDMGLLPQDVDDLEVVTNYVTDTTGLTHLEFRQKLNGLVLKNTSVTMAVSADGRVLSAGGYFVRNLDQFAGVSPTPTLKAPAAVMMAAARYDLPGGAISVTDTVDAGDLKQSQVLSAAGVSTAAIPVSLSYNATANGIELVWDMTIQTPDGRHWFNLSVDATSGEVLHEIDYVHDAGYNVYAIPDESPNHSAGRTVQTDPDIITPTPAVVPSPFGWHDTNGVAGAEFTITRGNNVNAYADADNNNLPDAGSQPDGGAGLVFNFPINLALQPITYRDASVTNLFYWNNVIHDVTYLYGFNEAARNFQVNNYGRGGLGNDAVNAEAQDGGGFNNANFATPADGSAPRMQMYLGNSVSPMRDGSLDNGVVVHEYGHGISNRLTGNGSGLGATQSGGMGEGWSDWFGLMFTQKTAGETTTPRGIGTYLFGQAANGPGIRDYRYQFAISNVALETFAHYGVGSTAVHATGTRWSSTLWDINHLLIQKYGYNPNLYDSTSGAGNIRAMHLVMNGLKMQPTLPTFLNARDAILAADTALHGGANHFELWTAFARRGLGFSATNGAGGANATTFNEAYDMPPTLGQLTVTSTVPAVGSTVAVAPTSFVVNFSVPVLPSSVQASDFTVNGIAASAVVLSNANQTATFTYGASPVVAQGFPQTMAIAANTIQKASDSSGNTAFSGAFRYDITPLSVVSTSPTTPGGLFTLPGPFTLDVNFNETIAASSIGTGDLALSQGTVTGAIALDADTARYTISGVTAEGTLNVSVLAGAVTDTFGNPNAAAFNGSYQVDFGTVAYPTPLLAKNPAGSLIYDPTVAGLINFAGDIDGFTLNIDPNQTITVIVTPTAAGLQPRVELFDAANVSLGFAQAPAAGQITAIQTRFIGTGGVHTIRVTGGSSTVGGYTVRVILNSAFELEGPVVGATNNTAATAQAIDGSFINLDTTLAHASRGAVMGTTDTAAGYSASAVPFEFTNIAGTGTPLVLSGDDAATTTTIPFAFNFYGTSYTTVGVSTNALLTFGGTTSDYINTSLSANPALATIAAFWDDLFVNGGTGRVLTQTIGAVGSRQFIVQWDQIHFLSNTSGDPLTFQAILSEGSNTIRFNYLDLDTAGNGQNGGTSATVGVKRANPTGGQFLDLAVNNGPNAFVGTGKSTLISPVLASADFYKFDATAGQRVSVALTNLSAGNVDVQLIDTDGTTVLASGVGGATNLNEAIQRFLIGATGTYYVRVTGDSTVPYSVVVTKDAVFDAEANDTRLTAQEMTGTQGALGALVGGGSNTAIANAIDSGWWDNSGFHDDFNNNYFVGQFTPTQYRDFFVFDLTTVSQPVTGATLSLFNPSTGYSSPDASETYSLFDVSTAVPALRASNSGQTGIFSDLGTGTSYGSIVVTTASNGQTLTLNLNAAGLAALNAARGGLFALGGAITTLGTGNEYLYAFTSGTETRQLTMTLGLPEDWYKVTLAPGETILEVETRTPADGTGEFVNTLNPKIQVFNAANVDITGTVTILGDGRNEKVRVSGLTAGATYFVRVSGEGTTAGEYFVGVKAVRTPTITTKVDDALPISVGPDGTFSVPNPVGNGWTNVTGAGYLNDHTVHADNVNESATNFATWNIKITPDSAGNFELFTSWVPRPQNATNATYLVYEGTTLRATVTVNQKVSPNDAVYTVAGIDTLLESLGTFQKLNPATAYFNVRLLTLGANGDVVADGVFDPPADGLVRLTAPTASAVVPVAPPARLRTAARTVAAASVSPWSVTATSPTRPAESKAKVLPPALPAGFVASGASVTVEPKRIAGSSIAWESLTEAGVERDLWTVAGTKPLRRPTRV